MNIHLDWAKCQADTWCLLDYVDLSRVSGYGVYVIWKPGDARRASATVRVGQGHLPTSLLAERNGTALTRYGPGLLVTWATVDHLHVSGVEAYLARALHPLLGSRFPLGVQYAVNLPISA